MNKQHLFLLLIIVLCNVWMSACANQNSEIDNRKQTEEREVEASSIKDKEVDVTATLISTDGEKVGVVSMEQLIHGVKMTLDATDLPPGSHGFHIHEKGVCELPDFESAGGHFNPTGSAHGFNALEGPHAGDLPNIEVGKEGTVHVELINERVTLEQGKENSLLGDDGTTIIIHSGADDYKSQPAGNAGERIACGVVENEVR
ncbi:MAG TPA: superoxide dismutase family protein [Bacillota bacterium]|nr:superoxide dismutase family protein [Bacillota bacterium]